MTHASIANLRWRLFLWGLLLLAWGSGLTAHAAPSDYFCITVVDQATGRGVPLVEMRTVNEVRFYTDSNGVVAIDEPDMRGQKVYFHISSPGYEYPKDSFGNAGTAFQITPGRKAVIKLKRDNIAERLYRLTGAGIYRDSILAGLPIPLKQPLLNGQVMGQDTVEVTPYQNKLFWFFGDTNRPSYPLGQFATSGAMSLQPGQGGLAPSVGVDLTYWVGSDGFSRPMIPLPKASGPVWVGGLFTMMDRGRTRLFTNFAEINSDQTTARDGLAEFNDDKAVFEPVTDYPKGDPLRPEGHPFLVDNQGQRYLYFQVAAMGAFPLVRNIPDLTHMMDAASFESFTCLAPGGRYVGATTSLDRAPDGHLMWGWKRNTAALGEDQANALVAAGKMRSDELLTALHDVETDGIVLSHGGSVFWNPYRRRWVMVTTQAFGTPSFLGEVWFAEADTPVGPWVYARKIATHDHYTFYNPTQHPFFDQDGGRQIYFEGTYVNTYSDVKDLTPRYNYNQLMYRLSLDDPRLALPAPVYHRRTVTGADAYGTRETVDAGKQWSQVQDIPFFAVPPTRVHAGLVPLYSVSDPKNGVALKTTSQTASPLCYVLPAAAEPGEKPSPAIVSLYEYTDTQTGRHWYATDLHEPHPTVVRAVQPLCRVWRNPMSFLALDDGAKAVGEIRSSSPKSSP
jgi:hypothetical protein